VEGGLELKLKHNDSLRGHLTVGCGINYLFGIFWNSSGLNIILENFIKRVSKYSNNS
jgi:hypothetical protein